MPEFYFLNDYNCSNHDDIRELNIRIRQKTSLSLYENFGKISHKPKKNRIDILKKAYNYIENEYHLIRKDGTRIDNHWEHECLKWANINRKDFDPIY